MSKAIATAPHLPTKHVELTPAEVTARQAEEAKHLAEKPMNDWKRDMLAAMPDDLENIIDALDAPTKARIATKTLDKYNAKKTLRGNKPV